MSTEKSNDVSGCPNCREVRKVGEVLFRLKLAIKRNGHLPEEDKRLMTVAIDSGRKVIAEILQTKLYVR